MRREDQLALLKSTPLDEQTIAALIEAFGAPKITKDKVDEAFDKFWLWYPKRPKHPKTAAYNRFKEICAGGVDPEALAYTAREYRKDMDRQNRTGTEFVKMASSFLSKRDPRWPEYMPKGEEHKWELKPKIEGDPIPGGYAPWSSYCERLLAEFGEKTYRAYFDNLKLVKWTDEGMWLRAESPFMAKRIAEQYGNRLSDIAGCPVRVVS